MPTQIADVVVTSEFSAYVAENSLVSTALFESGVLVRNPLIDSHLAMGSNNFNVPFWLDLGENDPDITSDNPVQLSMPLKLTANNQVVRKSFLHQSWSPATFPSPFVTALVLQSNVGSTGLRPLREEFS